MNNKIVKKELDFHGKKIVLETGELAFQANLAVKASYGESVVLATVVTQPAPKDSSYWPLSIAYEERLYSAGLIKGSRFVKRDGRPQDDAVVFRRLIDHAVRPLFPKDFFDETQVVVTTLSMDPEADLGFLSMIAASAVLHASNVPCEGPMTSARVGFVNGEYVLNPAYQVLHEDSELDMLISFVGDDRRFLAVEAEAHILPEDKILGAMEFARNSVEDLAKFIDDFAEEVNPGKIKYEYEPKKVPEELQNALSEFAQARVDEMFHKNMDKVEFQLELKSLKEDIKAKFGEEYDSMDIEMGLDHIKETALQKMILDEGKRPDGRGIREVRQISTSVGILPRVHGSGLFTRGVTQVLTVATLDSPANGLIEQDLYGERTKKYIHYYNFPPYSVGETGRIGGAGGREIGHGSLAEKALKPVIPETEEFPYMMLLTSETLSSSGSSSMAATCGSTLALMDAGVPIKEMVAGVGVGLIVNDDMSKQLVMTDLAYMEDAYGFLDFKMTGTRTGVTAIQADMKAKGIPFDLLAKIVDQSREGRLHVLSEMEKTISAPKTEVSQYAPKMETITIDPDKIGMVIGSGGKTIRGIEEKTGAELGIDDSGVISVSGKTTEGVTKAIEMIQALTKEVEVGEIYDGEVTKVVDFGAFVEILPGKEGLLHVSEFSWNFVKDPHTVIKEGDWVRVKVLATENGKISLSKKALEDKPEGYDHGNRGDDNGRGESNRGGSGHSGGRGQRSGGRPSGFQRPRR